MPLTLAACYAEWDDYLDFTETVTEMAHHLMKEDGQEVAMPPKAGTTPKKKEAAKSIRAPVNRMPTLPITPIDTEILDDWFTHPQVWDVSCDLQHARCVLALVRYTLPTPYKGQPAIVFGVSFVLVPTYQARTNLCNGLTFLKSTKEDSVVLVAMPSKPTYSPQPRRSRYLTLLPISGRPKRGSRSSTHLHHCLPPHG